MKPRQKFVRLSEGPLLVLPRQKKLFDEYVEKRGASFNQTVRDLIDYADLYGFFTANGITNGQISSPEGGGK